MSCEIQVFCEINPSEDPSKIKTAVLNIFPDLEISISNQQLIGKSSGFNSLSNIIAYIHTKNTGSLYQRILKKNSDEDSTWFYLNKQAAFVETVAICSESNESPLGPIKVILESNDIDNVIQSLTS